LGIPFFVLDKIDAITVRVIHPADNTGFILIFEKYSPEIKLEFG